MREIVLDTETTGLDPANGDRIVEIGAVELWHHMPTGKVYHQYINPERPMPKEAFDVHGLGDAFLSDKPFFSDIIDAFLDFVGEDPLVIHNASFDMKFINAELEWASRPIIPNNRAIDTLAVAKRRFPGSPASLDALCRRFGIDNSMREKHGALLDSEILAEVYLELIGGKQPDFALHDSDRSTRSDNHDAEWRPSQRPSSLPTRLTESEAAAHTAFVEELGPDAVWLNR